MYSSIIRNFGRGQLVFKKKINIPSKSQRIKKMEQEMLSKLSNDVGDIDQKELELKLYEIKKLREIRKEIDRTCDRTREAGSESSNNNK